MMLYRGLPYMALRHPEETPILARLFGTSALIDISHFPPLATSTSAEYEREWFYYIYYIRMLDRGRVCHMRQLSFSGALCAPVFFLPMFTNARYLFTCFKTLLAFRPLPTMCTERCSITILALVLLPVVFTQPMIYPSLVAAVAVTYDLPSVSRSTVLVSIFASIMQRIAMHAL